METRKGTTCIEALIMAIILNLAFWTPVIIALLIKFHFNQ